MRQPLATILACGTVLTATSALARPNLPKEQLAQLERGEVLEYSKKVDGSGVTMGKAISLVDDVPEAVTYAILAVDAYKHFLPRVTESRVVKQRGWHTYVVVHTDLPWPVKDCWAYVKFTRYDKAGRVFQLKWWMINGTMKNYTGAALIEPWTKDAKRSVLTYELLAEPAVTAPDSLVSKGVREVAATVVKRLKLRLKALRKFNKMPKGL